MLKPTHICHPNPEEPCMEVIQAETLDDMIQALDDYNKCADCCPVVDCAVCGPCEHHDEVLHACGIVGLMIMGRDN